MPTADPPRRVGATGMIVKDTRRRKPIANVWCTGPSTFFAMRLGTLRPEGPTPVGPHASPDIALEALGLHPYNGGFTEQLPPEACRVLFY